jgi:transposase
MSETTRTFFSAEQKASAVRKHLLAKTPVSQVCDELKISVATFYVWQKELFENAHLAFAKTGRRDARAEAAQQKKIDALEAKLQRKDGVIAELLEDHVALKKSLGES